MYNAKKHIRKVLDAILAQDYQGKIEVIVVNDGSSDRSLDIIYDFEKKGKIKILNQPNLGAVTATNNGFKVAQHDVICSIDSDVVLHKNWLRKIMEEFCDPLVGAVQGYYKTPVNASFWARMMGYDVEARYDAISSKYVTHVCTGNTAYRKAAINKVGLFDPAFQYGYDNDMSYRLQKAGYGLVFRKDALCDHYWKPDFKSYVRQQYWSGYGRLQLIRKHGDRITGDSVSGIRMILQVPLLLLCIFSLSAGLIVPVQFRSFFLRTGLMFLVIMLFDRLLFSIRVIRKQKDFTALFLPVVHLLRNFVWSWAFLQWSIRRFKKTKE